MKANSLKILSAVVTGLFVLGTSLRARRQRCNDSRTTHPVMTATAITKADADKKYPATAATIHREPVVRMIRSCIEPISAISTV